MPILMRQLGRIVHTPEIWRTLTDMVIERAFNKVGVATSIMCSLILGPERREGALATLHGAEPCLCAHLCPWRHGQRLGGGHRLVGLFAKAGL